MPKSTREKFTTYTKTTTKSTRFRSKKRSCCYCSMKNIRLALPPPILNKEILLLLLLLLRRRSTVTKPCYDRRSLFAWHLLPLMQQTWRKG